MTESSSTPRQSSAKCDYKCGDGFECVLDAQHGGDHRQSKENLALVRARRDAANDNALVQYVSDPPKAFHDPRDGVTCTCVACLKPSTAPKCDCYSQTYKDGRKLHQVVCASRNLESVAPPSAPATGDATGRAIRCECGVLNACNGDHSTKRPWAVVTMKTGKPIAPRIISDDTDEIIVQMQGPYPQSYIKPSNLTNEANARLIVSAVNSIEALRAANARLALLTGETKL